MPSVTMEMPKELDDEYALKFITDTIIKRLVDYPTQSVNTHIQWDQDDGRLIVQEYNQYVKANEDVQMLLFLADTPLPIQTYRYWFTVFASYIEMGLTLLFLEAKHTHIQYDSFIVTNQDGVLHLTGTIKENTNDHNQG